MFARLAAVSFLTGGIPVRAPNAALWLVAFLHMIAGEVVMSASAADRSLILERTIPLENVTGRIDHMAIDLAGGRLFVAELGNDSVDAVDLPAGEVTQRLSELKEPQGIAYIADRDMLVVANGGDGSARLYRAGDMSFLGSIALGKDADNVRIDPVTGHVLVGYGNGGLAILDPTTHSKVGDIRLVGHPESFQLEQKTGRVFVNVPDAQQIAVADLKLRDQVAAWKVPGLAANFPMAFDDTSGQLAVAFRRPARLVLLNTTTGAVTESVDTCGDADDVFFDRKRGRIYVSCGDGRVDIVQDEPPGLLQAGYVATSRGARTALFVPEIDRLLVAAPSHGAGSAAAILVFRPSD